jgi:hypothetical protein
MQCRGHPLDFERQPRKVMLRPKLWCKNCALLLPPASRTCARFDVAETAGSVTLN